MSNIIVTGGAGFIGTNFVQHWLAEYPADNITVIDSLTYAGNRSNIEGLKNVDLVVADICDTDQIVEVMNHTGASTLVHFAAESHVDRSIDGPDEFIRTNIVGTHSLLKAAKTVWLDGQEERRNDHRFHHVSTDEVYGSLGNNDPAFNENTPYSPNSPYSASKAASDHLVRAYHHTYGLNTSMSNCSNNYGPFQFPEKLIPLFFINCLTGKPLPIYGDGMNIRDWLHVEDHCAAITKVIKSGTSGETYAVGGGSELTNMAVIETICQAVDKAFEQDSSLSERFPDAPPSSGQRCETLKTFVDDRLGHDRRYAIDDDKIRAELNYSTKRTFQEGFESTLKWYLDNEQWWTTILNRG